MADANSLIRRSSDMRLSMGYSKRVVKKRSACLTDTEWLLLIERGKPPRPCLPDSPGREFPPADVRDLVDLRILSELRWRVEQLCMALMKPNAASREAASSSSSLSPGQLLSSFAEIWDFLTKPTYQDGSQRLLGKVSLACSSGGLQVTLTDPTSNSYCCVTATSLDDAFLALEVGLKQSSLPWRISGYANGKKR